MSCYYPAGAAPERACRDRIAHRRRRGIAQRPPRTASAARGNGARLLPHRRGVRHVGRAPAGAHRAPGPLTGRDLRRARRRRGRCARWPGGRGPARQRPRQCKKPARRVRGLSHGAGGGGSRSVPRLALGRDGRDGRGQQRHRRGDERPGRGARAPLRASAALWIAQRPQLRGGRRRRGRDALPRAPSHSPLTSWPWPGSPSSRRSSRWARC